jgi:ABC-type lipoprotein release transport system permease subunit
MSFLFSVAWRNLWRQRRRTLITSAAIATAVSLCMFVIALNDGTFAKLFEVMVEQQLGHARVHHADYPSKKVLFDTIEDAQSVLDAIDDLDETQAAAPRLNGFALIGTEQTSAGGQLIGVLPGREAVVTRLDTKVVEGAWLDDAVGAQALLGTGLAKTLKIGVGDEVVVITQAADGSMGNALIEGIKTFDRKFNDDTELCWREVYSGVSHDLRRAVIYEKAGRRRTI